MRNNSSVEVILNVYYLGDMDNPSMMRLKTLSTLGIGLYHSGIELNGVEYSYGGDPTNSASGVFQGPPLSVANASYKESYFMGVVENGQKCFDVLHEVR